MSGARVAVPQVVCILLLLWAIIGDSPYGYYVLLRWVCSPTLAYLAWHTYRRQNESMAWAMAVAALVYNPLVRIHATRGIWTVVNVVTVVVLLVSIGLSRRRLASSSNSK